MGNYEFRHVMEHIEVYKGGEFVVSADNMKEAREEVLKIENPCKYEYNCGWYDSDVGCTCSSLELWYQCPFEPELTEEDFKTQS